MRRRAMASAAALEGVTSRKSSTRRSSTDPAAGRRCQAARAAALGVGGCCTLTCADGVPPAPPMLQVIRRPNTRDHLFRFMQPQVRSMPWIVALRLSGDTEKHHCASGGGRGTRDGECTCCKREVRETGTVRGGWRLRRRRRHAGGQQLVQVLLLQVAQEEAAQQRGQLRPLHNDQTLFISLCFFRILHIAPKDHSILRTLSVGPTRQQLPTSETKLMAEGIVSRGGPGIGKHPFLTEAAHLGDAMALVVPNLAEAHDVALQVLAQLLQQICPPHPAVHHLHPTKKC